MRIKSLASRTFGSLAVYNYRLFWFGQLISLSGTWMQTTAQGWLVLKLTNSPLALGTVTLLQFLPITLLTLFGGVLADRVPKRQVLLVTQSVSALQACLLAALVLSGTIQLWQIYLLALLLGTVNAFDTPTRQAFVSELVGKDHLQNAVALNSSLFNAARIIGPALAGIVIAAIGIGPAFLFNGLSFFPVIAGLLLMRPASFYPSDRPQRGKVFVQLGEGIRYAVQTPKVFLVLLTMAVVGTFGYNYTTILPLLAKYVLQAGAEGLGLLTSAVGVGSLVAALAFASATRTSQRLLLGAGFVFSVLLVLVGLSRWLPLTLALLVLMGASGIIYTASSNTSLQLGAPGELRGRVLSLYFLLFAGTTPIGGFLVGVLTEKMGVQPTIVLMGSICVLGVVAAMVYAWRTRLVSSHQPLPTGVLEPTPLVGPPVQKKRRAT
ncbi:MAG: MFS transporter [Ktedonobacterales bacterium]